MVLSQSSKWQASLSLQRHNITQWGTTLHKQPANMPKDPVMTYCTPNKPNTKTLLCSEPLTELVVPSPPHVTPIHQNRIILKSLPPTHVPHLARPTNSTKSSLQSLSRFLTGSFLSQSFSPLTYQEIIFRFMEITAIPSHYCYLLALLIQTRSW